jgi:hypothetical protein
MLLAGRLATAVGYLWLLLAILSGTGLLGDVPVMAGSAFYSLALIFLGRALRKRGVAQAEKDYELGEPPITVTPPVPTDVPKAPEPTPTPAPVKARPKPAPSAAEPPDAPQPLPEPIIEPIPELRPKGRGPAQPATEHKTSRELIEEARARWGKRP